MPVLSRCVLSLTMTRLHKQECSPAHMRGKLIMIEGALITGGIMLSYWIDFAFYWIEVKHPNSPHVDAAWRVPIALQITLALPTLFLTMSLCESPRFLMLKDQEEDARQVLSSLMEVPSDHAEVNIAIEEIRESVQAAKSLSLREVYSNGPTRNLHRVTLGIISQCFQQISGINLITYYAAQIFQNSLGFSDLVSRVLAAANGTEYFAASWIAFFLVEHAGRRPLMLFGAAGQCLTMMVMAITNAPSVTHPELKDNGVEGGTNTAAAVIAVVCLFLFNTFFAIGWLGMTWLTPAEMTPLVVRAAANGVATASNWVWNFVVVMIAPIAFTNIDYNTYTVFCALNAFIYVVSYFIFPETRGRSLEEMDDIFAQSSKRNPYDVVKVEKRTPRKYDRHGHPVTLHHHANTDNEAAIGLDGSVPEGGRIHPSDDADAENLGGFTSGEGKKEQETGREA